MLCRTKCLSHKQCKSNRIKSQEHTLWSTPQVAAQSTMVLNRHWPPQTETKRTLCLPEHYKKRTRQSMLKVGLWPASNAKVHRRLFLTSMSLKLTHSVIQGVSHSVTRSMSQSVSHCVLHYTVIISIVTTCPVPHNLPSWSVLVIAMYTAHQHTQCVTHFVLCVSISLNSACSSSLPITPSAK